MRIYYTYLKFLSILYTQNHKHNSIFMSVSQSGTFMKGEKFELTLLKIR